MSTTNFRYNFGIWVQSGGMFMLQVAYADVNDNVIWTSTRTHSDSCSCCCSCHCTCCCCRCCNMQIKCINLHPPTQRLSDNDDGVRLRVKLILPPALSLPCPCSSSSHSSAYCYFCFCLFVLKKATKRKCKRLHKASPVSLSPSLAPVSVVTLP